MRRVATVTAAACCRPSCQAGGAGADHSCPVSSIIIVIPSPCDPSSLLFASYDVSSFDTMCRVRLSEEEGLMPPSARNHLEWHKSSA